jgi:7-keto-8-aminopelargonate synthetase-like enzyme
VADAQDVAFAIDVFGANVQGFAHAQSAMVDEGEVGAVASAAKGFEKFGNLFAGEDVG